LSQKTSIIPKNIHYPQKTSIVQKKHPLSQRERARERSHVTNCFTGCQVSSSLSIGVNIFLYHHHEAFCRFGMNRPYK
jgi:hypothetical protein